MFGKNKKIVSDFSELGTRGKLADKKSVFDSDFIGKEGQVSPRTIKEAAAITMLLAILGMVFYFNFFFDKKIHSDKETVGLADIRVLENISFESNWHPRILLSDNCIDPMLRLNKLLAYKQKHSIAIEPAISEEKEEVKQEKEAYTLLKKKIFVKGVLWNPKGGSSALIDREVLSENETYQGYKIACVTKEAVTLEDLNGQSFEIRVGESREIIAIQSTGTER